MQKKAIFLDRDGVINEVVFHPSVNKPSSPWRFDEFKLITGVKEALLTLSEMGFILFIISNQPDIARGYIKNGTTEKINKILKKEFPIRDIYICPHDDHHDCKCRKPKPGMIIELSEKYNIDLKKSFLIGDGWKDIWAGKKAGCTTILIKTYYNTYVKADIKVEKIEEVVDVIKEKFDFEIN